MLYEEFIAGTKAPDTQKSYEQYEVINKIYSDCDGMTKETAYRLWKQSYGKQNKLDVARTLKMVHEFAYFALPVDSFEESEISRRLFAIGEKLIETNEFRAGYPARITDANAVTYEMSTYNIINGHRQAVLKVYFQDKEYETKLIYSFGQLRIVT